MYLEGVCSSNLVLLLPGQAGKEEFDDSVCCITVSQPVLNVGFCELWDTQHSSGGLGSGIHCVWSAW